MNTLVAKPTATGPRRVRTDVEDARLAAIRRTREAAARKAEEAARKAAEEESSQSSNSSRNGSTNGYYNENGEYQSMSSWGYGGKRKTRRARKNRRSTRRR